jgi:hypothetical protein
MKATVVDSLIRIFVRICFSDLRTMMVLGSFNTNYIIFRNLEIFKFFFFLNEKNLGNKILNLQECSICQFQIFKKEFNIQPNICQISKLLFKKIYFNAFSKKQHEKIQ